VRAETPIDLPRPRDLGLKRTAGFVELVDRIWKLIEGAVGAEGRLKLARIPET